ncbi:MAG TPA: hypothetical protein VN541_23445 [Tepidisphaeraceae bacterium]|nr:hypothetical protein [Tepidisphaeraceae bacterium]
MFVPPDDVDDGLAAHGTSQVFVSNRGRKLPLKCRARGPFATVWSGQGLFVLSDPAQFHLAIQRANGVLDAPVIGIDMQPQRIRPDRSQPGEPEDQHNQTQRQAQPT